MRRTTLSDESRGFVFSHTVAHLFIDLDQLPLSELPDWLPHREEVARELLSLQTTSLQDSVAQNVQEREFQRKARNRELYFQKHLRDFRQRALQLEQEREHQGEMDRTRVKRKMYLTAEQREELLRGDEVREQRLEGRERELQQEVQTIQEQMASMEDDFQRMVRTKRNQQDYHTLSISTCPRFGLTLRREIRDLTSMRRGRTRELTPVDLSKVSRVMGYCFRALARLHVNGILHGDFHMENIFVPLESTLDNCQHVCVHDFQTSIYVHEVPQDSEIWTALHSDVTLSFYTLLEEDEKDEKDEMGDPKKALQYMDHMSCLEYLKLYDLVRIMTDLGGILHKEDFKSITQARMLNFREPQAVDVEYEEKMAMYTMFQNYLRMGSFMFHDQLFDCEFTEFRWSNVRDPRIARNPRRIYQHKAYVLDDDDDDS